MVELSKENIDTKRYQLQPVGFLSQELTEERGGMIDEGAVAAEGSDRAPAHRAHMFHLTHSSSRPSNTPSRNSECTPLGLLKCYFTRSLKVDRRKMCCTDGCAYGE